eukprot:1568023-Pyramimonas_sp.AAC.1
MAAQITDITNAVGNATGASQAQFLAALQRRETATAGRLDGQEQCLMAFKNAQARQEAQRKEVWDAIDRIDRQLSLSDADAPILDV